MYGKSKLFFLFAGVLAVVKRVLVGFGNGSQKVLRNCVCVCVCVCVC